MRFVHGDVRAPERPARARRARRDRRVLGRAVGAGRRRTAAPTTRVHTQPARRLPLPRAGAPRRRAGRLPLDEPRLSRSRRSTRSPSRRRATRFELAAEQAAARRVRAPASPRTSRSTGARTLYGATKLAGRAARRRVRRRLRPAARSIDRCGVIAGPVADGQGRPGRLHLLDAGATTSGASCATSATAARASRCATCCTSTTSSTSSTTSSASPDALGRRRPSTSAAAARRSLSLRETTELCRELTGNERGGHGARASSGPATCAIYLSDCARLFELTDWRPRRDARADPGRHLRLDRGQRARRARRPCLDRGAWPSRSSPARAAWSAPRPSSTSSQAGFDVSGSRTTCAPPSSGPDASTRPVTERLVERYCDDVPLARRRHPRRRRRRAACSREHRGQIELVVHAAAQPSHDWAASRPADRLRASTPTARSTCSRPTRRHAPDATFVFLSTNKVYGDLPNQLPARGARARGSSCPRTTATSPGIDTSMSIDALAALAVRRLEGRGRPDGAGVRPLLRHADRLLPRRLPDRPEPRRARSCTASSSYLMRCTITGEPYTVFGYGGKQVRDNIHSADLVRAFAAFQRAPAQRRRLQPRRRARAATARCSRRSTLCERIAGRELRWELSDEARMGDHRWWISDLRPFERDYPDWRIGVRRRGDPARDPRRRTSSAGSRCA